MKYLTTKLTLILIPLMSISTLVSGQPFASGTGTINDPYIVATPEHLHNIRTAPDAHFRMNADIDLTDWINTHSPEAGWTPLGDAAEPFSGTLDGNGHVISGIWSNQAGKNVGLFGVISGEVSISKLGVVVAEGRRMKGTENIGILVGMATNDPSGTKEYTIDQVFVSGTVEATTMYAGGMVGFNNWMHVSITDCYAMGSVLSAGNATGGIVGNSWGAIRMLINRCYAFNDLTCNDGSVGGIVGAMSASAIDNMNITLSNCASINKSIKSQSASVGRIYGWVKDEKITLVNNIAFDGVLINESVVSGLADNINGLDKTADELAQQNTYSAWDFTSCWQMGNYTYQLPVLKNINPELQPTEEVDLTVQDDNPFRDLVDMYGTLNAVDQCGANPNGRFDNTEILQYAIDACAAKKATLVIPAGRYIIRPLFLKSNVTIDLKEGATLLGSTSKKDYDDAFPGAGQIETSALIYGRDILNVKIMGKGKIDGRGGSDEFMLGNSVPGRPKILHFIRCNDITIEDIELTNSAFWTSHFLLCDGVTIRGVKIYSHSNWNNDGIDIDSKNVLIEDCYIDCDDDGICMKSDRAVPCENVVVRNCVIRTNCSAIKLGTAGKSGFKNISYSNCTISKASEDNFRKHHQNSNLSWAGIPYSPSVISGIALESVDGGILEDVTISDIEMEDVHNAIFIRLGDRARAENNEISQLKNVTISDVKATAISKIASTIAGVPGGIIENITIKNVEITVPGGGTTSDARATVPEVADKYPENNMFGIVLPAYGFYVRHAKGITFENVKNILSSEDARPEYVFDDVEDYQIITSIHNISEEDNFQLMQNGDQLEFTSGINGKIRIQLVNIAGAVVYASESTVANETLYIEKPAKGVYLLAVTFGQETITKKIMIE